MRGKNAQTGFTLIELMMVVAIIGIVASIAIPNFQNFTMRTKAAERKVSLTTIKNSVSAYFTVRDSIPGGFLMGDWNPYPFGTTPGKKLPFSQRAPGWAQLESAMEGQVFYTYTVMVFDFPGFRFLQIGSDGDLDGDGIRSEKWIWYDGSTGPFLKQGEWPDPSLDGTAW